jgi:hypothetical protein
LLKTIFAVKIQFFYRKNAVIILFFHRMEANFTHNMTELFQTTKQNISLHIKNIYEEGESSAC